MAKKKKEEIPLEELDPEQAYILDYVRRNIDDIDISIPSRTIDDSHMGIEGRPNEGFYFDGH